MYQKLWAVLLLMVTFIGNINAQNNQPKSVELSLEEAIEYALKNSYATQSAEQDIFKAQKQIWETTTMGLPQVNAGVDYTYNIKLQETPVDVSLFDPTIPEGTIDYISFGVKQSLGGNVSISQLIFDGSYIVALQSSRVYAAISDLAKLKTDIAVKQAVSMAYASVLSAEESIETLKGNIKVAKSNLKDISAMHENGLAEEQDVMQLELTLSSLNNALQMNNRSLEINREMLKYAMGMKLDQVLHLSDDLDAVLLSNYKLVSLEEALNVEGHIDYQISMNTLKTNELLIKYEKSKYLPNISAFFNAGYTSFSEVFDFFTFDERWRPSSLLGVSFNIPIFSSFQRKVKVDMAKIDYKKASIDHERLLQELFTTLHKAQNAYAFALDNYETSKKSLKLAQSIEHKETIKYKEGISSSLTLASAQGQLYQQQENYLNAIMAVIQAKIELDKALNKL